MFCCVLFQEDESRLGDVQPLLPASLFQRHVIPEVTKIFHVRDLHVRLVLLCHFSRYCHLFERDVLLTVVVPQVRKKFPTAIQKLLHNNQTFA